MPKNNEPKKRPDPFLKYSSMAVKMIAIILVFVYAGHLLDGVLEWKVPFGLMVGAIAGSALAVYSMIKSV